jgi:ATP-binding cassette subfamily B protein
LLNGTASNNLSGITTIKSFTSEDYGTARVEAESDAYYRNNTKVIALPAPLISLIETLILDALTVLLILGGMEGFAGQLPVSAYTSLVFLVQLLLLPLTRLEDTFDLYERTIASSNRVMDLLDTPIDIHTASINLPVDLVRGTVEFQNVTSLYEERPVVFKSLWKYSQEIQSLLLVLSVLIKARW